MEIPLKKEIAEDIGDEPTYTVWDTNWKTWDDEDHFSAIDSDFTSEITVHFGEDELYDSLEEAIEHMGELP